MDKWIIDGIIAKVTSAIVVAFGTLLRALQTGVVHAYAAMMVVGVGALGWFFMWQPHADTIVREGTNG
jgi:NADH-quinone oxidoreductase subunit L